MADSRQEVPDIAVTPEMIKAGVAELEALLGVVDTASLVQRVYIAMAQICTS